MVIFHVGEDGGFSNEMQVFSLISQDIPRRAGRGGGIFGKTFDFVLDKGIGVC